MNLRCPVFVARQRTAREVLIFTPATKTMLGLTAGIASKTTSLKGSSIKKVDMGGEIGINMLILFP